MTEQMKNFKNNLLGDDIKHQYQYQKPRHTIVEMTTLDKTESPPLESPNRHFIEAGDSDPHTHDE